MTVPVLNSHSSYASASGGNMVFNKPTVSVNDVLIVIVATDSSSGANLTVPSGWLNQVDRHSTGGTGRVAVFTHVVTGSEGSTFTFSYAGNNNPQGCILAVSGMDTSFPIDVQAGTTTFSQTFDSISGVTTRLNDELLIGIDNHNTAGLGASNVLDATGTDIQHGSNQSYNLSIRDLAQPTLGASGAWHFTWDKSGATGTIVLLALRPSGQNIPPAVNVGPDLPFIYGDTLSLTATANDVEGPLTYSWSIVSAPSGSTATLSGSTTATISFKPDKVGAYDIRCSVTDSGSTTVNDDMILTVRAEMWTRVSGVAKPGQRRIRKNGALY